MSFAPRAAAMYGLPFELGPRPDHALAEGDVLTLGSLAFQAETLVQLPVINTPSGKNPRDHEGQMRREAVRRGYLSEEEALQHLRQGFAHHGVIVRQENLQRGVLRSTSRTT